ncbi:hypothetical protein EVAR_88374_1 [Eumeta japonica]|uniref:Uncharacterized protein n=1 Tax=Eumeta variegata TaxID=151549 RepID=A0A4C1XEH0_EUMVA|nr:hypothetical protein EVAR_88374_1 [Eumeta japonica]
MDTFLAEFTGIVRRDSGVTGGRWATAPVDEKALRLPTLSLIQYWRSAYAKGVISRYNSSTVGHVSKGGSSEGSHIRGSVRTGSYSIITIVRRTPSSGGHDPLHSPLHVRRNRIGYTKPLQVEFLIEEIEWILPRGKYVAFVGSDEIWRKTIMRIF